MLKIKNLTKVYGDKKAVDNLSLHIRPGEIYGFIGHNGAGKTTTIKSCCGILQFEEGEILIDGTSVKEQPLACKAKLAYIPDNPDLYDFMTGIQFLNFVADIFKVGAKERQECIRKYADMFELTEDLAQPISAYSHGMKQKLAIISALVHEPKLIIMDVNWCRDDIFTDTDRTKFFEFIIPVIPIINSTNSGEIFLQKLEESEKKGIVHEISQEFILDVSPYVEDMRILQNIYNEFIVYKETIRTDQELKLSDETMMALIIFKNLYPREFAELQMERGVVKQAFEDKQRYIQLELEFDIPIETVEKQKVEILIKKKYIPFDIKKYDEIKEVYPDLCPDFILYNQAEYMEVMEKIPMGETLLETLLLSSVLDSSNAEVLLNVFGENYMTTHIAQYLLQIDVKISISVFNTAWTYLLTDEIKNKLMLKYCSILNAPDFEECFSELSKIYPKFGDRSKRHNAEMANTNENKKLADRLKEVGYITSYTEQEKDDFDPVKGTGGKKNIISCWIKMVKM